MEKKIEEKSEDSSPKTEETPTVVITHGIILVPDAPKFVKQPEFPPGATIGRIGN